MMVQDRDLMKDSTIHLIPDVDECQNPDVCAISTEVCQNTDGGYHCVCPNGYQNYSTSNGGVRSCDGTVKFILQLPSCFVDQHYHCHCKRLHLC